MVAPCDITLDKATTIPDTNSEGVTADARSISGPTTSDSIDPTASANRIVSDTLRAVVERSVDKKRFEKTQPKSNSAEVALEKENMRQAAAIRQLRTTLDIVAVGLEHDAFRDATDALAAELASKLQAERVSIGFLRRGRVQLLSLSNKARFSHRTDVVRDIETAMQESIDQADTLVFPLPDDRPARVTWAHARLSRRNQAGGTLTVPLSIDDKAIGAITAECPAGLVFAPERVELLEMLAALLSPLLEAKRRNARGVLERAANIVPSTFRKLVGPDHLWRKLFSLLALGLLVAGTVIKTDFRVSARAELEGAIQRTLVSPISGYIATASARPGDQVEKNQLLASLEDQDLRLESTKLQSRKNKTLREYRAAVANHDRAKVAVLRAQTDQIQAELDRANALLERTRILAPFDGLIVSGDLSQALGAPVERGQVLLEVAPLEQYRVVLETDERDLEYVTEGQPGQLVLAAHPGRRYLITVQSITPVATSSEGSTFFRVEASLDQDFSDLRPRMDGVAKLNVGERSVLWIWTRRLVDTLSLWLWTHWQ